MRALLMLAVLLPLMAIIGWVAARGYMNELRRRRHVEDLEHENERLDDLIGRRR